MYGPAEACEGNRRWCLSSNKVGGYVPERVLRRMGLWVHQESLDAVRETDVGRLGRVRGRGAGGVRATIPSRKGRAERVSGPRRGSVRLLRQGRGLDRSVPRRINARRQVDEGAPSGGRGVVHPGGVLERPGHSVSFAV